jgi:hypothetical protein
MKEAPGSSETSVLTRATRRNNPEDTILHSHRRENLKSYITTFDWPEGIESREVWVEAGSVSKFLTSSPSSESIFLLKGLDFLLNLAAKSVGDFRLPNTSAKTCQRNGRIRIWENTWNRTDCISRWNVPIVRQIWNSWSENFLIDYLSTCTSNRTNECLGSASSGKEWFASCVGVRFAEWRLLSCVTSMDTAFGWTFVTLGRMSGLFSNMARALAAQIAAERSIEWLLE